MLDIAQKMRELIPLLHTGINEVSLPDVRPGCEDEWSPDYAVIEDAYHLQDDHYFNEAEFWQDVRKLLLKHFAGPGEHVVHSWNCEEKHPPGTIVISHRRGCNEIEVYREKPT